MWMECELIEQHEHVFVVEKENKELSWLKLRYEVEKHETLEHELKEQHERMFVIEKREQRN